jgi:hypothetical protein
MMSNDHGGCPGHEGWASNEGGSEQTACMKPSEKCEISRPLPTAEFQEMLRQSDEAGEWMRNQLKLLRHKI